MTPRDRVQRLLDLTRKTLRYWWLVTAFSVVGGALSLAFAVTRPHNYQSYAVLFYQERIQSSLLQNRQEEVQRNIGDRYRELLFARGQLIQIINDPKLNPFPDVTDPELAIDKLRNAIHFEARGTNAFRITFNDVDPDRAKLVTESLTKLLKDKDEALRNERAQATADFAIEQKNEAVAELNKREQALAEFLAKHPEFAQDLSQQSEGASIRAVRTPAKPASGNARLDALERQRARIQARLDAPADAPAIRMPAPMTPERVAAEAALSEAQRELAAAQRELEDAQGKYTEKHPTVIKAQDRVTAAQQRVRHAETAVHTDAETVIAPATPADRTKLEKDLAAIESQIADVQKATANKTGTATTTAADASIQKLTELETDHAKLRRGVNEQREFVGSLADSVFRAQMDARRKLAEAGGTLSVVDPAFKPVRPTGPGKTTLLLVGMLLFWSVGAVLAIGLGVIDDRLYHRDDVDQLGVAVLAVIPRAARRARQHEEAAA